MLLNVCLLTSWLSNVIWVSNSPNRLSAVITSVVSIVSIRFYVWLLSFSIVFSLDYDYIAAVRYAAREIHLNCLLHFLYQLNTCQIAGLILHYNSVFFLYSRELCTIYLCRLLFFTVYSLPTCWERWQNRISFNIHRQLIEFISRVIFVHSDLYIWFN